MIKSKLISRYKNLSHGFFNNMGGYSKGIYKSLNCGVGSNDNKDHINANILKVCKKIKCKKKNLILMNQIHSNKVYFINDIIKRKPKVDGLITNKKKIALGILTADCAPVFIYDAEKNFIAAVHAGWKGAYKKIINKTLNILKKRGSKIKNLIAVIGPCIAKDNYEVKKDFLTKFIKESEKNKIFFTFKSRRIFFSLNEYIGHQFKKLGVKNIEIIKKDTYLDKNNFFSSRKSAKKKFDDYGRNISIIMIK